MRPTAVVTWFLKAPVTSGPNVLATTVNGSLCSPATSADYLNKPCVSVTICDPSDANPANCQVIGDILVDTGSYGLRIFAGAFNPSLPLAQLQSGSSALVECVPFADLSSLWGPVKSVNVKLAGEPKVQIPIQVIDVSFAAIPVNCPCATTKTQSGAKTSSVDAGYTGILRIGSTAKEGATSAVYYLCYGTSCCKGSPVLANQVVHPVARLAKDTNEVMVRFPPGSPGGVASLNGSLVLGSDTALDNASTAITSFRTDAVGDFPTVFTGSSLSPSLLDTGSNGLFSPGSLPDCPNAQGW